MLYHYERDEAGAKMIDAILRIFHGTIVDMEARHGNLVNDSVCGAARDPVGRERQKQLREIGEKGDINASMPDMRQ
jgi:hypothetical protein